MRLPAFFAKLLRLSSIPDTLVEHVTLTTDAEAPPTVVVRVAPRVGKRQRCGQCHRKTRRRHGATEQPRVWRHVGVCGVRVELHGTIGRVVCSRCGVKTAAVPWGRVGARFTRAFENEVAWFLQHTDQTATARYFGLSWVTVGQIAKRVVADMLDGSLLQDLRSIGVDEISYGRPTKFLTVVVDHERGRVVWAAEGKSSETLNQFFTALGPAGTAAIQVITMDMSAAFEKSVSEQAPQAEIVYDRFHVVRLVLDAVDEVRRAEMRGLTGAPVETERATLQRVKRSRWALLKNPWNLTRKEQQKLSELEANNRRLFRAYLLKEAFQAIYDARTVREADRRFREWYGWARRSRLPAIVQVAATLRAKWMGIRRFIELRITNAGVEGYNSKIRLISHRAYGFHSGGALIAMIMLLCSGIKLTPLGQG
jgi:transposase